MALQHLSGSQQFSRGVAHARLDIEGLYRTASNESVEQASFRSDITQSLATHQTHLTNVLDVNMQHVDSRINRLEQLLLLQNPTTLAGTDEAQFEAHQGRENDRKSRSSSMSSTRSLADPYPLSTSLGIRVKQRFGYTCRPRCVCVCHQSRGSSSPSMLKDLLGRLFVGYAGLPLLSPTCDVRTCKTSQMPSVTAEYWFPLGYCWSTVLRLQMAYHAHLGPQVALSTLRSVPDSAQSVAYALEGNIDGLRNLFDRGLASPKDVSITRGYTLLRVRLALSHLPFAWCSAADLTSGHYMVRSTRLVGTS